MYRWIFPKFNSDAYTTSSYDQIYVIHVMPNCACDLQAANDLKTLLKKENITLLSTVTFDDSTTEAVSQIKVHINGSRYYM